jgi:hypothetical protein
MPSLPVLITLPEIRLSENLLYYVMVRVQYSFGHRVESPDIPHVHLIGYEADSAMVMTGWPTLQNHYSGWQRRHSASGAAGMQSIEKEIWWRRVDSNHGPTDYETVALAT